MPVPWDCFILCVILKVRMFAQENNVDCVENVASAVPQATVPKNRPWTRELENKPEYSLGTFSLRGQNWKNVDPATYARLYYL